MGLLTFFKYLRLLIMVLCTAMFIALMAEVWKQYVTKMTTIGVQFHINKDGKKMLPVLTVCAVPTYKELTESVYAFEQYRKVTYSPEDIFYHATLTNLSDPSLFEVKEIFTIILGRCYAIQKKTKVGIFDFSTIFVFKATWDLQIFIHNPGEEIWLVYSAIPWSIASFQLNANNDEGYRYADLSISQKNTTYMSKPGKLCRDYQEENGGVHFIDCVKKDIWKSLSEKINCTSAFFKEFLPLGGNATIGECRDKVSARSSSSVFRDIMRNFVGTMGSDQCPLPCKASSYDYKITYMHKNSSADMMDITGKDNDTFLLYFYYNSIMVEERTETLIYDLVGILAAAGGHLGLCLGFSCFTLLITLCECLELKLRKWKH